MRNRLLVSICFVFVLFTFTGCPAGGSLNSVELGNWLFFKADEDAYRGLGVLANGMANSYEDAVERPIGAKFGFAGPVSWQQNGNSIMVVQQLLGGTITWDGTLQNSTFMTGTVHSTFDPLSSVNFTATKTPSELLE